MLSVQMGASLQRYGSVARDAESNHGLADVLPQSGIARDRLARAALPVERAQLARSWPGNITPSSHRLLYPSLVLSVNSACGGSELRGESVREENLRQPTEAHRWNCVQLAE